MLFYYVEIDGSVPFGRSRLPYAWSMHSGRKLGIIKSISLDYIVDLRNQLTHGGSKPFCSQSDANLGYDCLMSWLAFIGYQELDRGVEKAFTKESPDTAEEKTAPSQTTGPNARKHSDYLKQLERFLRKIRRFLNKGGALIPRGVDDGALVSYGDDGLVEKIIDQSIATRNISDRFHARKFYAMLRATGFTDVKMHYVENDTVGLDAEERDVLFRYYFKFRSDYTKRQLDADPDNPEKQRLHAQMVEDLEDLEDLFLRPEFYFMVMTITAVAIR